MGPKPDPGLVIFTAVTTGRQITVSATSKGFRAQLPVGTYKVDGYPEDMAGPCTGDDVTVDARESIRITVACSVA
jgi:hypothetical protein